MLPLYLHSFLCFFVQHVFGLHISVFALYPADTTHNLYGSTTLQRHHPIVLSQCIYVIHFYSLHFYTFTLLILHLLMIRQFNLIFT
jgi:hypothetical protein